MKEKLSNYLGKNVEVVSLNGKIYRGCVDLFTPARDNDDEEDAISSPSGWWLGESEIKSIRIVEEPS